MSIKITKFSSLDLAKFLRKVGGRSISAIRELWFCRICHSAMPTRCRVIVAATSVSLLISPFFFHHADRLQIGICSSSCGYITTIPKLSGSKTSIYYAHGFCRSGNQMADPCSTMSRAAKTWAPQWGLCVSAHDLPSRAAAVWLDLSHVSSGHPCLPSQVRKKQVEAIWAWLSFRT